MPRPPERPRRRRRVAGERATARVPRYDAPVEAPVEPQKDTPFPLAPPVEPPTARPTPPKIRPGGERPSLRNRLAGLGGRLRPTGAVPGGARSWTASVAVLAAVVLALGIGSYFLQDAYHGRGDTKSDVAAGNAAAEAAGKAIVEVLSYNYRTFDEDVAAAEAYLTGDFKSQYLATQMDTVKRTARRFKATVEADVVAAGAIRAEGDTATVLIFVDQTATNTKLSAPRIDKSRVRAEMVKVDGRWLISGLDPI